jgi:hypothetical protein
MKLLLLLLLAAGFFGCFGAVDLLQIAKYHLRVIWPCRKDHELKALHGQLGEPIRAPARENKPRPSGNQSCNAWLAQSTDASSTTNITAAAAAAASSGVY